MTTGLSSGAPIICRTEDGGIGFTIPASSNPHGRAAIAMMTITARAIARMSERDRRTEYARMDREVQTRREQHATTGLILRAPDRTIGKVVVFDGTVQDVRENNGSTLLDISTDLVGNERFDVRFPGLADDAVVRGARVHIYGMHADTETRRTALGEVVVPVIYACAIRVLGER